MENENKNYDYSHTFDELWIFYDVQKSFVYSVYYSRRRVGIPYIVLYFRNKNKE